MGDCTMWTAFGRLQRNHGFQERDFISGWYSIGTWRDETSGYDRICGFGLFGENGQEGAMTRITNWEAKEDMFTPNEMGCSCPPWINGDFCSLARLEAHPIINTHSHGPHG